MTADDVTRGDWVLITHMRKHYHQTPFGVAEVVTERPYSGTPLCVLAVQLPFLVVLDGEDGTRGTMDLRYFDIIAAKAEYVNAIVEPEMLAHVGSALRDE